MASPSLLRVGFRDGPERHSQHPAIEAELIALYLIKPRIISLTRADPLFFLPTASPLPSFTIFHLHLPREQPSLSLSLNFYPWKFHGELSPHTTFLCFSSPASRESICNVKGGRRPLFFFLLLRFSTGDNTSLIRASIIQAF